MRWDSARLPGPLAGGPFQVLAVSVLAGASILLAAVTLPTMGAVFSATMLFPVALGGWWFGRKVGLVLGAATFPVSIALFLLLDVDIGTNAIRVLSGQIVLSITGYVMGALADATVMREKAHAAALARSAHEEFLTSLGTSALDASLQALLTEAATGIRSALDATGVRVVGACSSMTAELGTLVQDRSVPTCRVPFYGAEGSIEVQRAQPVSEEERSLLERAALILGHAATLHVQRLALAEQEARARTLVESTFDGIVIHEEGVIREANPAFARLFGYPQDEIIGKAVRDLIDESSVREVEDHIRRNSTEPYGVIGRTKTGGLVLLEVQARPCTYQGRPARTAAVRDVTQRAAAENALRESEERFRTLFENVSIGLYRTTPDGRVLLANPALVRMLGYTSIAEIVRRDLNAPEATYVAGLTRRQWMARMDTEGEIVGLESTWRRKDGSFALVRESARAIRGPDGRVLHYEGTVEDITAQKKAEADARAGEAVFRTIFDNSPIGMIFFRLDGAIYEANDAFLSMCGYDRADLKAGFLSWKAMTPPELAHLDRAGIEELRATGHCRPFQKEYIRKDGSRVAVVVAAAFVGAQKERCVAFVIDVDERERARRELAATQARQAGILDASVDAIVTMAADGSILEWNPAAERTFGYTREEAVGQLVSDIVQLPETPLEGDGALTVGARREVTASRRDGTLFPCEVTIVRVEHRGEATFTAFVRDLTDLKRLEEYRRAQSEAMARSERLSALGTLVAGVAHEINNPLTYISGNIELALLDVRDAARHGSEVDLHATVRGLESALGGAERIGHITRALKAVARQRSSSEREAVDVNVVLANAAALLGVGIPDAVSLEVVPAPVPAWVHANVSELHQVILNLARNAIEALAGQPEGRVRLSAHVEDGIVGIRVEDNGPGVPPDVLPRLFTPFFTTKPQGTGLGLSIVHGIVRDHGGDITVMSNPRDGTIFNVRLPRRAGVRPPVDGPPAK